MPSRSIWLFTLFALLVGCNYPRDPAGSLERIRSTGVMRVGFSLREPWVTKERDQVSGIEPRLIRAWAARLGARIEWVEGSESGLIEALHHRQLDIVVAGFTDNSPWRDRVGMSQPFAHVAAVVTTARKEGSAARLRRVEGQVVSYPAARPHFAGLIAAAGAAPAPSGVPQASAVAAYDFELDRLGLRATGAVLARERHVVAVAPGENALLLSLDRYLASAVGGILFEGANGS